jgi:hypothetical protein
LQYLGRSSPASLSEVKIAVIADYGEVVLFSYRVLIGIIEIQVEPLTDADEALQIRSLQANQLHSPSREGIFDKL